MTKDNPTVESKMSISREARQHLRVMSAETGATMSGIVEDLIENEWKRTGHTAAYSARYAGTYAYTTHADERRARIIEMHDSGMSVEQIVAALPHDLPATHDVVEHVIEDADADLVEQMRKGVQR